MKFAISAVLLLVAIHANASVIPLTIARPTLTTIQTTGGTAVIGAAPHLTAIHAVPSAIHGVPVIHGLHAIHSVPAISAISSAPGSLSITHAAHPHAITIAGHHAPIAIAEHPAAIAVAAAPAHVVAVQAAEGSYVAANRGTVHTAPLAGHADSAVALNLEPAPGTV